MTDQPRAPLSAGTALQITIKVIDLNKRIGKMEFSGERDNDLPCRGRVSRPSSQQPGY